MGKPTFDQYYLEALYPKAFSMHVEEGRTSVRDAGFELILVNKKVFSP